GQTAYKFSGLAGIWPCSTRLTASISLTWLGVGTPTSRPFSAMTPLIKSISVRRPLYMSWPIDGRARSLRVFELGAGDDRRSISSSAFASPSSAPRKGRAGGAKTSACAIAGFLDDGLVVD